MPKSTCAACAAARMLCAKCAAAPQTPFDGLPVYPEAAHAMLPGARQMMSDDDDDGGDEDEDEDEKPKGKRKGDDDDDDDDNGKGKSKRKRQRDDDDDADDDRPKKKKAGMGIGMILGIVGGLGFCCVCLPGVGLGILGLSGVRAAAAQTQSINNLKQIALGFHSFHDANKRLPFNGSDAPSAVGNVKYSKKANANDPTSGSWAFQILPYIDQNPMYTSVNTSTGVNVYMCPGRGRPNMEAGKGAWTDYFINGYVNNPEQAANPAAADMKRTLIGITDGTSNTIMVGHGLIDTGDYTKSANVPGSSNIFMGGTMGTMRSGNNGVVSPQGMTLSKDSLAAPGIGSWGGPFQQGALMAMGDATVRLFPYTTARFGDFLTPFGNEVVTLPDT